MTYTYTPKGVCSRKMTVELDEGGVIKAVRVDGGCSGNLQGIAALVRGMPAEEAIQRLNQEKLALEGERNRADRESVEILAKELDRIS